MSDDDVYSERLRRALHGEGSAMEIADDGLARIFAEAHQPGSASRRPAWLAPLAVAAAAVILLGGVAIGVGIHNRGNNNATPGPGTSSSPTGLATPTSTPTPSGTNASGSPSPSQSGTTVVTPPPGVATAIYYVAAVPNVGTRLYREFHTLPIDASSGKVGTALAELFGGNAVDPDYSSLWPTGTQVVKLAIGAGTATVDVSDFPDLGPEADALAIQQVVWTVTAASPTIKHVTVTVNGKPPLGSATLAKPVARGNALTSLSNVLILTPTEGATVTSPVKVSVYGTGFEGNVPLEVWKDGSKVTGQAVTTQMGAFATASTTVTLPAGTYELRAYNDNGKDGALILWDTKTFTVS